MSVGALIVETKAVSKTFGDEPETQVHAVQAVSLSVRAGELVLISGPSGSGKTTLLSLIGGLLSPSRGEVIIAGTRLGDIDQARITSLRLTSIGFVFQAFHLLEALTVRENVELPLNLAGTTRPSSRIRAEKLIAELGLAHRAAFLPATLSGGEKQRAAIARALANDPPLLLADEPTGSLDSRAGQEVIEVLHQARQRAGRAVIIVSHDTRIARYADRVLAMEDGQLISGASPVA